MKWLCGASTVWKVISSSYKCYVHNTIKGYINVILTCKQGNLIYIYVYIWCKYNYNTNIQNMPEAANSFIAFKYGVLGYMECLCCHSDSCSDLLLGSNCLSWKKGILQIFFVNNCICTTGCICWCCRMGVLIMNVSFKVGSCVWSAILNGASIGMVCCNCNCHVWQGQHIQVLTAD